MQDHDVLHTDAHKVTEKGSQKTVENFIKKVQTGECNKVVVQKRTYDLGLVPLKVFSLTFCYIWIAVKNALLSKVLCRFKQFKVI